MLTGEFASNIHVSSLLTKYEFTANDKFRNLYSAVSDLTARFKHKIVLMLQILTQFLEVTQTMVFMLSL